MVNYATGLSASVEAQLTEVVHRYTDVDRVLLFGSRATGNFKSYSDIDLAVCGDKLSDKDFTQLWNELDALPLVFKLDVLHLERLQNESLKKKILSEGKVFYQKRPLNEAAY